MSQESERRREAFEDAVNTYTITELFEKDARTYVKASNAFGVWEFDVLTSDARTLLKGNKVKITDESPQGGRRERF